MKTAEEILKERGSVYGPFDELSEISQDIEHLIIGGNKRAKFTAAQREAIKMVSSKLARLACGDPNHLDSWLDASNYLKLAYDDTLKKVNPKRYGQWVKLSEAGHAWNLGTLRDDPTALWTQERQKDITGG